jgi:hypothetical protein
MSPMPIQLVALTINAQLSSRYHENKYLKKAPLFLGTPQMLRALDKKRVWGYALSLGYENCFILWLFPRDFSLL